jgi:DUF1365 family protein
MAIVDGNVMHRRTRPAQNAFRYRSFCQRLPLSALAELPDAGIAYNARGLVAFHDADHGARDGSALEPWVRALLAREGIDAPGEIVLYTLPRMLGYVFNPVSFWTCPDATGRIVAVLAEVNNTFGDRHSYVVAHADGRPIREGEPLEARKALHVSPFCTVSGHYRFRFVERDDRFLARIDYFDAANAADPLIVTAVSGDARPLRRGAARSLLWRHRWFTAAVVLRIHWQALRLWRKRVPFFARPHPAATPSPRRT